MEDSFRYVPADIVLNILPSLPAKSLLRFRCVSKQWSGLISKTKLRQGQKFISRSVTEENAVLFRTLDEKLQVKDIDLSHDKLKPRKSFIRASCDGLLLINVYSDLFLWNPAIHSFRKILSCDIDGSDLENIIVVGMCFDSCDDAYKVVIAVKSQYVQVGSSKTNSWKIIPFNYSISSLGSGPVLNNYLHLYAAANEGDFPSVHKIIYFEPKKDSFYEVPMPDPKRDRGDFVEGLGVLDGCLCKARLENYAAVEVLVMKEYGVKESWKTLFKIGEVYWRTYLVPFSYSENKGKVLMRIGNQIVTVDMRSGEKVVKMEWEGYLYEETLVEPCNYLNEDWKSNINIPHTYKIKKVIVPGSEQFLFQSINQFAEVEDIEIQRERNTPDVSPHIYGSCKEFLLIRVGIDLVLWNLRARNIVSYRRLAYYPHTNVVSGLWCNSDTWDFKVVLVLDNIDWRQRLAVVGDFGGSRNSWSEITIGKYNSRNLRSGPTLNNHIHFWSSNADSTDQIIYFDPIDDTFVKIPLPDLPSLYNRKSCIRGLGVLRKSLCMVHSDSCNFHKVYQMKQYGVKESWTCMFQFNYKSCSRATPLFFSNAEKSEVLIHAIRSDGYAAIVSCDIGKSLLCKEIVVLKGEGPMDGPFVYEEKLKRSIPLKKVGTTSNSQKKPNEVWYADGYLWPKCDGFFRPKKKGRTKWITKTWIEERRARKQQL